MTQQKDEDRRAEECRHDLRQELEEVLVAEERAATAPVEEVDEEGVLRDHHDRVRDHHGADDHGEKGFASEEAEAGEAISDQRTGDHCPERDQPCDDEAIDQKGAHRVRQVVPHGRVVGPLPRGLRHQGDVGACVHRGAERVLEHPVQREQRDDRDEHDDDVGRQLGAETTRRQHRAMAGQFRHGGRKCRRRDSLGVLERGAHQRRSS